MMTFAALADPTRFHIIEMLATHGRLPVSKIKKEFTISAPAVSQHLKVLKEAKLVCMEVNAQQRIYMLNPEGIAEIEHWTAKMRRMWEARFDALEAMLQEEQATQPALKESKKT